MHDPGEEGSERKPRNYSPGKLLVFMFLGGCSEGYVKGTAVFPYTVGVEGYLMGNVHLSTKTKGFRIILN